MSGKRVVVPGFANKVAAFLPRVLPRGSVLSLVGARQERRQEALADQSSARLT
jgi:hypothetical protein